ncbi:hypothetical protein ACVRZD_04240 [Streptococcus hongkongensis]|nr:hypothetical protein NC01_01340 [Streptococcus uberis]
MSHSTRTIMSSLFVIACNLIIATSLHIYLFSALFLQAMTIFLYIIVYYCTVDNKSKPTNVKAILTNMATHLKMPYKIIIVLIVVQIFFHIGRPYQPYDTYSICTFSLALFQFIHIMAINGYKAPVAKKIKKEQS